MARSRTLKPAFFTNEELGATTPLGRLLFAGLWGIADRRGRLEDRPARIKITVLPYDDCDIDALLAELARRGFITRYAVQDSRYIQIITFEQHQRPNPKEVESVIPPPPDAAPVASPPNTEKNASSTKKIASSTPRTRTRTRTRTRDRELDTHPVNGVCVSGGAARNAPSTNGQARASPATHTHDGPDARKKIQDALTQEFAPLLGGEERARASIAKALNDPQSDRWKDFGVGLRLWLERDVAYEREHAIAAALAHAGGSRGGVAESTDPDLARIAADQRERRRRDAVSDVSGRGVPGAPAP